MASEKPALSEKAVRYIDLLSEARCDGKWAELPELARKVEKHSGRKCLAMAAKVQASQEQRIVTKPPGSPNVPLEPLMMTIPDPSGTKEDQYQGRVCVQWLHWIEGKYDQAILAVPPEIVPPTDSEKASSLMGWTFVCMVQSAYVRGACYEAIGKQKEAITTYRNAAARILSPSNIPVKETAQYKFWSERLLNRYCRITEPAAESSQASGDQVLDTLEVFRTWSRASMQDVMTSGITVGGLSLEDKLTRRTTWLSYYRLLSSMVLKLSGGPGHLNLTIGDVALPSKLELCTEVQHVESVYERILVREISFPRADEFNSEAEDWVSQAMLNWAAFVGPAWGDQDVPQPGKRALSRKMLDVLYRASTKTFQSMSILRGLSTVHASLGEFEMAARALDSYISLSTKAKARIQKSGEREPGVDTDDTMANAIAAGIEMLCTVGNRKEAARAQELTTLLSRLLDDGEHLSSAKLKPQSEQEKNALQDVHLSVSTQTLSVAHRAMGISNARWAQLTFDPQARSHLQTTSVKHLRRSLQGGPLNESNLDNLYALGLACAQNRDVAGAIAAIKEALLQTLPSDDPVVRPTRHSNAKSLHVFSASTRCWHLLTLLLTSRQDFENAAASCDEAFEQFGGASRAELFTRMSLGDKQNLLSLKASRIAIKQVLESTEAAINESASLLSLHGELFPERSNQIAAAAKNVGKLGTASVASGGRSFSIRESILGKSKSNRSSANVAPSESSKPTRRNSDATSRNPPTLGIPEEEETSPRPATSYSQKGSISASNSKRLQKRPSKKSVRAGSSGARQQQQQPATDSGTTATSVKNVNKGAATAGAPQLGPQLLPEGVLASEGGNANVDGVLGRASASTYVACPAIYYSEEEYLRRSGESLAGIWLFISSLYREAGLYSDSADSLHEAFELVRDLEAETVTKQGKSSAEEFERSGWGSSKSIEELWADVYAERGELRLAQGRTLASLSEFESALAHLPDHPAATVGLANILLDIYTGKVIVPSRADGTATAALAVPPPAASTSKLAEPTSHSQPILATVPDGTDRDGVEIKPQDGSRPATANSPHHRKKESTISIRLRREATGGPGASSIISSLAETSLQDADSPDGPNTRDLSSPIDDDDDDGVVNPTRSSKVAARSSQPEVLDRLAARDRAFGLVSTLSKLGSGWDRSEVWFALARAYEESGMLDRAQHALWWVVELERKRPIRRWEVVGQGFSLWY